MDRRNFLLSSAAAVTLSGCSGRSSFEARPPVDRYSDYYNGSLNDIVSGESFENFRMKLETYTPYDNSMNFLTNSNEGNPGKYWNLIRPLFEGGLSELDVQKAKYAISQEVASAYQHNTTPGFRKNSGEGIMTDSVFFGDIPGIPEIVQEGNFIFDNRLQGDIGSNPYGILKDLGEDTNQDDVGFIIQDQNGVLIFVYYEAGELKYAAPTSPGVSYLGETPNNGLTYGGYKDLPHYFHDDTQKKKKINVDGEERLETEDEFRMRLDTTIASGRDVGGSMPYARRLLNNEKVDGFYSHIGDVNGRPASHGCVRFPAWLACIMFYEAKTGTHIYYRPEYRLGPQS